MGNLGHSRYQGLRCPHCAGKLPGYVDRDAELARIREQTMVDTEVVRLQHQLRGAVSPEKIDAALDAVPLLHDISDGALDYLRATLLDASSPSRGQ